MKIFQILCISVLTALSPASNANADETSSWDGTDFPDLFAYAGMTAIFTIKSASGPFADEGRWQASFDSSSTRVTVKKLSGNTVKLNSTYRGGLLVVGPPGSYTYVTIDQLIPHEGPVSISFRTEHGTNRQTYEATIEGNETAVQTGSFSLIDNSPEISVRHELLKLTDGSPAQGLVMNPTDGTARFAIRNTGTADLTGLGIVKTGVNKSDFVVSPLYKTILAPGASTTIRVKFKPTSFGVKKAAIHISSNDDDENPFDIKLTGTTK